MSSSVSGRYDAIFPLETSARPMFDLIGSPAEHKGPVISEEGHAVPRNEVIAEVLSWFDQYLRPIQSKGSRRFPESTSKRKPENAMLVVSPERT